MLIVEGISGDTLIASVRKFSEWYYGSCNILVLLNVTIVTVIVI